MNYYDAARIRKKGFANLMTDKLASGQGVISSFRGTMSDRSKANSLAMKERFDPMNIAKFLTGGSNLAPAIVGRLTGRSKEDIGYFTGKKQYQYTPRQSSYWQRWNNPNMGGSRKATEVLEKIVSFMEKSREEDIKEQETLDTYNELNEKMKLDNHKEVINVFKEAIKNKRKAMKEMAKEAKKRQAQEKAKEKTEQKKTEVKKEEPKPEAPKPEAPKPQAPKPEAPKPEAPKPEAPKPQAPKPEAPKPTAKPVEPTPPAPPTAAPAPPTVTPKPPVVKPAITEAAKTAAKVVTGTALGVIASKETFAQIMLPQAQKASQKLSGGKIPPEALVAQWALESGWGKSLSGDYNYFGTKADKSWKGDRRLVVTREYFTDEQAKKFLSLGDGREILGIIGPGKKPGTQEYRVKDWFRSYSSLEEAVDDKTKFLIENKRYSQAGVLDATTSQEYFERLQKAGYAGTSNVTYASTLMGVVPSVNRLVESQKNNSTLKSELNQPTQNAAPMVNQNNITNRQRNITVTSPPIEELNPRMRR